jgi:CheY-like chemotaxis protein/HPt (histidine-containing phosphotransfer) domain-containing protein
VNRKVASEILRRAGCLVTTASSGHEAIETVRSVMTQQPALNKANAFDVFFMDIQMPDMDGVETTAHLREQFGKSLPTIVAMTAYSMREDRERFISQGLDDYIAKPIRAQSLVAKVKEIVDRKQATHQEVPAPVPIVVSEPDLPIIDAKVVGQLLEIGGSELVDSIMAEFVTEAGELIDGAIDAYALGDVSTVKSHLHTLKGSAGTIGVARVADIARRAEGKLKLADTSGLDEALQALKMAFDTFLAEWQKK